MSGTRGGLGRIAGTRGGVGRIAAMAIGLVVALALALAETAAAGTYNVAQCGWGIGAELDPTLPKTEGGAGYLHPSWCTAPPAGVAPGLGFETGIAAKGDPVTVRARWAAPPGTTFVGAHFTWAGALGGRMIESAGIDDGVEYHGMAVELESSGPHPIAAAVPGAARAFEVRLECLLIDPEFGCDRSVRSAAWLGGLTLTVDDPVPPGARLGGSLVGAGWHRGTVPVEIAAEDAIGAGVAREEASVDGAPLYSGPAACAVAAIEGEVRATRLRPCPPTATQAFEVDTARLVDGVHTLRGCAVDLGGGQGCAPEAQFAVDNSAPEVEFAAAPEGQVAARVSDPFSGPAAGTISMRRADSEAWSDVQTTFEPGTGGAATLRAQLPDLSAGAYFFRATATDAAGNSGSAQLRASGSPAELRRQIAAGGEGGGGGRSGAVPHGGGGSAGAHARGRVAHLAAHLVGDARAKGGERLTVDYGSEVEVRGRLTDSRGRGISRRAVAVIARAAGGFGGAPERRRVVTGRAGRFTLRLPPGTSRRVTVTFHGGGGFAAAPGRPLALRVRAAVGLAAAPRALRTGGTVHFLGTVRRGKARIPNRGKLVAIQYLDRASDRWRPALVIRTGGNGHFHAGYRFRYITGAARIRFRATALPEAGWPYAPGSSTPVTVKVDGG